MGRDLWESSLLARELFEKANEIIGFNLSDIMFQGSEEDLKQTRVTQPSIFVHSVVATRLLGDKFIPSMVAGHSLGEFSALVACGALNFEDGLRLVIARAEAMQKACEINPSTMAAILGLDDEIVKSICEQTKGIVVAANYNSPGQIIISGTFEAVQSACTQCSEAGAKRTLPLNVGGAFHSPLMEPARKEFEQYIEQVQIKEPSCPIVQNVDAQPHTDPPAIKENLKRQLTSPVLWSQSVLKMIQMGADSFQELGPGKVLGGLIKKIDRNVVLENS
jgi:[acyl-carrier-protein] S-malonyltransferase